jgi:hypothetical protein
MAALHSCTAHWQDPRDALQTSSWRSATAQPPQHLLFAAVAVELRRACRLGPPAQKASFSDSSPPTSPAPSLCPGSPVKLSA